MKYYEITKNGINERITFIDGIAIITIVLYHSLAFQISTPFNIENIGMAGLALFTFSAGLKMGYNHFKEMSNKEFLKKYFVKRLVRLYKPYIGYTALIFIPVYFEMYIAKNLLHLKSDGITRYWDNLNINGLIKLIIGSNFVSSHLWYLILMILITLVCFIILYCFNTRGLFLSFFLLIVFNFSLLNFFPNIFKLAFVYSPIYIFGIFYASCFNSKLNIALNLAFSVLFVLITYVSLIKTNFFLLTFSNFSLLIYGLFFSCFIILIIPIFSNIKLINSFFTLCGKYSFQIYLFHVPLVLHPLNQLIRSIFGINSLFIPYLVTILTIYISIFLYIFCKKFRLNVLFE
jgi:peptidoglycan/LPS O-acetylase OafA/YrhL